MEAEGPGVHTLLWSQMEPVCPVTAAAHPLAEPTKEEEQREALKIHALTTHTITLSPRATYTAPCACSVELTWRCIIYIYIYIYYIQK